jgi:urea transporter
LACVSVLLAMAMTAFPTTIAALIGAAIAKLVARRRARQRP